MKKKELKAKTKELEAFIELANEIMPTSLYLDRAISTDEVNLMFKYHNPYYPIDHAIKKFDVVAVGNILHDYTKDHLPLESENNNAVIVGEKVYVNGTERNIVALPTRAKTISWWYSDASLNIENIKSFNRSITKDEIDVLSGKKKVKDAE